jgi:hypothetical protein
MVAVRRVGGVTGTARDSARDAATEATARRTPTMSDPKPTRAKKAASTPRTTTEKSTRSTRSTRPTRSTRSGRPRVPPEAVAARAYERFAARGYVHGHALEDWVVAERELGAGEVGEPLADG